jgi:hypothetical protein
VQRDPTETFLKQREENLERAFRILVQGIGNVGLIILNVRAGSMLRSLQETSKYGPLDTELKSVLQRARSFLLIVNGASLIDFHSRQCKTVSFSRRALQLANYLRGTVLRNCWMACASYHPSPY